MTSLNEPIQWIEIVDAAGKVAYSNAPVQSKTRVDVSNFQNGVYFLKIMTRTSIRNQQVVILH